MRMGDGLQYFVTSLADFPDKLGFAGDWMLQSYASARAEQVVSGSYYPHNLPLHMTDYFAGSVHMYLHACQVPLSLMP